MLYQGFLSVTTILTSLSSFSVVIFVKLPHSLIIPYKLNKLTITVVISIIFTKGFFIFFFKDILDNPYPTPSDIKAHAGVNSLVGNCKKVINLNKSQGKYIVVI